MQKSNKAKESKAPVKDEKKKDEKGKESSKDTVELKEKPFKKGEPTHKVKQHAGEPVPKELRKQFVNTSDGSSYETNGGRGKPFSRKKVLPNKKDK